MDSERPTEPLGLQGYKKHDVELTADAKVFAESGSPEAHVFNSIPAEGISMADLQTVRARRHRLRLQRSCSQPLAVDKPDNAHEMRHD